MATVADVLKRIERIKKDLEYVRTFQEKWRDQRERFPEIYEGILKQERAFLRKIDDLKGLRVDAIEAFPTEPDSVPAPAPADGAPVTQGALPGESSDEKRAAADGIGEKLRKRGKGETSGTNPAIEVPSEAGAK